MKIERTLWWMAITCAFLLLLAPLSPRITWVSKSDTHTSMRIVEGIGWLGVAPLLGFAVMGVLVLVRRVRHGSVGLIVSAAAVMFAFGITGAGIGYDWHQFVSGTVQRRGFELDPIPMLPFPVVVATIGCVATLALMVRWRRPKTGYC